MLILVLVCVFLPEQGYAHSVPNSLLGQTAQNARELDFQYSPFAQSMQSRNNNNASSLGGQSISMPEVKNIPLRNTSCLSFLQASVYY